MIYRLLRRLFAGVGCPPHDWLPVLEAGGLVGYACYRCGDSFAAFATGEVTLRELATVTGMSEEDILGGVDELEDAGFLARVPSDSDILRFRLTLPEGTA